MDQKTYNTLQKETNKYDALPLAQDMKQITSGYVGTSKPMTTLVSPESSKQIGGDHYTKCFIQPWDYVIANNLDYFQGSIIKYVTRWRDKNGVEDLQKAMHFLTKYIEHETQNAKMAGLASWCAGSNCGVLQGKAETKVCREAPTIGTGCRDPSTED